MKFITSLCSFLSLFYMGYAHPFKYDLHLTTLPGSNGRTMVCCHGYGSNYEIGALLKTTGLINATLIRFNFPDHDITSQTINPKKATFGTIQELLPAFYVLKTQILDQGKNSVDLYGFSAGGGAVINIIAVLNSSLYDSQLQGIGITAEGKKNLLNAIQNGIVVLDVQLKSIDEIIAFRGATFELETLAQNYRLNQLRPIDSLERLKGLSLDVIIYFNAPDAALSNRDDQLYIAKLKQANSLGTTIAFIQNLDGHTGYHYPIWQLYSQQVENNPVNAIDRIL